MSGTLVNRPIFWFEDLLAGGSICSKRGVLTFVPVDPGIYGNGQQRYLVRLISGAKNGTNDSYTKLNVRISV